MADQEVTDAGKFSVEVSANSHLVFSGLRQFREVVFWERPEIPDMPFSDGDLFLTLNVMDRIDNLAVDSYEEPELWWVLALANGTPLPPLLMQPGFQFRIPPINIVRDVIRGR